MYKHAGWQVIIPRADGVVDRVDKLFLMKQVAADTVTSLHQQGQHDARIVELFYYDPIPYTEPKEIEVLPVEDISVEP
jgi:hypothetical protein